MQQLSPTQTEILQAMAECDWRIRIEQGLYIHPPVCNVPWRTFWALWKKRLITLLGDYRAPVLCFSISEKGRDLLTLQAA